MSLYERCKLTLGSKSRTTPLPWLVRDNKQREYFSACSKVMLGYLRKTCPCLLQMTYPSTPDWTLMRSIVSSTSLYMIRKVDKKDHQYEDDKDVRGMMKHSKLTIPFLLLLLTTDSYSLMTIL